MTEKEKYKGMTWAGFAAYLIDRHLIKIICVAAILFPPTFFSVIYWATKEPAHQKELLDNFFKVIMSASSYMPFLGWATSGLLIGVCIFTRKMYKSEIERISKEKQKAQEDARGKKYKSSGHKEG